MGLQTMIRPVLLPAEAIAAKRPGPLFSLPFVDASGPGMTRFWAPRPRGDYAVDCEIGRSYGEALVRHMRQHGDVQGFRHVMLDLVKDADPIAHRGVLVGFFGAIGDALRG